MGASALQSQERLNAFQIVILILSVLVLCLVIVQAAVKLPKEISTVLHQVDTAVCLVFFFDFCVRFHQAQRKFEFMKLGWIDLLASIPNVDALRIGRLVRVLRIIQLLRGLRSFQRVLSVLSASKPRSVMASVLLATFLLLAFSSVSILVCEDGADANIKTAEDAVWWSVTTITTVGYGDKYPTTSEGRVVAMLLMVSGVGLFGTLSGVIASTFVGRREPQPDQRELVEQIKLLTKKVDSLARIPDKN